MAHLIETKSSIHGASSLKGAIPAEVDLGSPRHPDCRNFGICRINFLHRGRLNLLPSCCPNRAQGYLRRWEENGVELIFPKENMAPATLEKYFGDGWFSVEGVYELSGEMAAKLGLFGFTFQPGRYPVLEMGGRLHVVFA